jgi:hypothetical protein
VGGNDRSARFHKMRALLRRMGGTRWVSRAVSENGQCGIKSRLIKLACLVLWRRASRKSSSGWRASVNGYEGPFPEADEEQKTTNLRRRSNSVRCT